MTPFFFLLIIAPTLMAVVAYFGTRPRRSGRP